MFSLSKKCLSRCNAEQIVVRLLQKGGYVRVQVSSATYHIGQAIDNHNSDIRWRGGTINNDGGSFLLTARTTWRAPRLGERLRVLTRLGTLYL
jgi:hypothetical protein